MWATNRSPFDPVLIILQMIVLQTTHLLVSSILLGALLYLFSTESPSTRLLLDPASSSQIAKFTVKYNEKKIKE
jgi:hypothetical protein